MRVDSVILVAIMGLLGKHSRIIEVSSFSFFQLKVEGRMKKVKEREGGKKNWKGVEQKKVVRQVGEGKRVMLPAGRKEG